MCVSVTFCKHAILLEKKKCVFSIFWVQNFRYRGCYRYRLHLIFIQIFYLTYFLFLRGMLKSSDYILHNYSLKVQNLCFICFEGFKKRIKGSWQSVLGILQFLSTQNISISYLMLLLCIFCFILTFYLPYILSWGIRMCLIDYSICVFVFVFLVTFVWSFCLRSVPCKQQG